MKVGFLNTLYLLKSNFYHLSTKDASQMSSLIKMMQKAQKTERQGTILRSLGSCQQKINSAL